MDNDQQLAQLRERLQWLEQRNIQLEQRNAVLAQRLSQQYERLAAIVQIITALRATPDRETVLALASSHVLQLISGAEHVLIWLFDQDTGQLVLQTIDGNRAPYLAVRSGQGLAGRVFKAPRAMKLTGAELSTALFEHNTDDEHVLATTLGADWPPLSVIAAPLRIEQVALGVLVLHGGAQSNLLMASDLQFVQTLSDLLAVAIAEAQHQARVRSLDQALTRSRQLQAEVQQQLDAAQAGLLQSAKLAAVGQLAASVAHEINNPLYAVRTSLHLVLEDLPSDAPQRPFLDLAQQELARIARIIARMRDFYKPARSEFQPADVNDLIRETLDLARTYLEHKAIVVVEQLDLALPPLDVSVDQIRQVVLNLILNACDAMDEGGRLVVTSATDKSGVIVQISDTGCGIPADVLDRLWEPFFTTKPNGTGLGLSVSYHIVAQHGGTLQIESTVGHGTTCTVRLPFAFTPSKDTEISGYNVSGIWG